MEKNVCHAAVPSTVVVKSVCGPFAVRLLEMGITPGQNLSLIRKAPTGYPLEIQVRGFMISLRREEAEGVVIDL